MVKVRGTALNSNWTGGNRNHSNSAQVYKYNREEKGNNLKELLTTLQYVC